MADKVAILGTVPNSRVLAPYDDPSWDIWCCSAGNSQAAVPPRVTEWFEIHSLVDLHAPENQHWYPAYANWLKQQTYPVWMQERNEDVPRAQVFPRKPLLERWGPGVGGWRTNWFTSSPAWMFAYAIHRGYKTIGIWGVDMAAAEEHYTAQKAALLRWFEIARELGIKVVVPLESTLAIHYPVYGYAEASRGGRALLVRKLETQAKIQHFTNQARQLERDIAFLSGALQQITFDERTFVSGHMDAEIDVEPGISDLTEHLSAISREQLNDPKPLAPAATGDTGWIAPSTRVTLSPPVAAMFTDNPDAALLPKRKLNGPLPHDLAEK